MAGARAAGDVAQQGLLKTWVRRTRRSSSIGADAGIFNERAPAGHRRHAGVARRAGYLTAMAFGASRRRRGCSAAPT
jgi:hypothetical protein